MIRVRRSDERGHTKFGWLDSRHTFSFGDYYDPGQMNFRSLRVINDDRIAPAGGFPTHPHRDMEILTYVVEGELEHQDSMGNGSVIRPGDVQRMSAGTGIQHSEFNPSKKQATRLLQIWLLPERRGITPGYEQKNFAAETRRGGLKLVASHEGRDGSVAFHQDADLYAALLAPGTKATHRLEPGRHAWIQVVRGGVSLNGEKLGEGDGAAVSEQAPIELAGVGAGEAELLLFDLA